MFGTIIEFDATEKRRSSMKNQALEQVVVATRNVSQPEPTETTVPDVVTSNAIAPNIDDFQTYMVNFVVEQTGYPEEIVELDADLEGDLGIDSIKKVQLFAELGERFEIHDAGDLTPDDFPTLRHIVDFLATNATSKTGAQTSVTIDTQSASTSAVTSFDKSALQAYMVNFVVEQTGYPEEIVELDADLEGDLGIDSIKKVQLFAELGERFEIHDAGDLTPDDFPTLRHIVDFLATNATSK